MSTSGRPVAGGQVERVDPHAGGAERDGGAADRVGQAQVLVFGVDDGDLHPVVEGAQESSLTRYDLPAPERASTTLLWLCCAHRSHQTIPAESVLSP